MRPDELVAINGALLIEVDAETLRRSWTHRTLPTLTLTEAGEAEQAPRCSSAGAPPRRRRCRLHHYRRQRRRARPAGPRTTAGPRSAPDARARVCRHANGEGDVPKARP